MAKLSRTKELWHIPKRGNGHQTIYMVHLLTGDKFSGKSWSRTKQELLATEMGKAGLTEKGIALSHQSVRTLLANIPKYLGFIYIDESTTPSRLVVTEVGHLLVNHHKIQRIKQEKNLKTYRAQNSLIETSRIFNEQMLKLIMTNPIILNDCQHILVFPFRFTLKLLLELDYLDKEEIAYILFHVKNEDELLLIIQKIKNFRALPPDNRTKEITAYKKTQEGILTLVKAPSSGYYMYLCESTGICKRIEVTVNKTSKNKLTSITLTDKEKTKSILKKFNNTEIYDFKDDWFLWKEYYTKPQRIHPPISVSIKSPSAEEFLVSIKNNPYETIGTVSNGKDFVFPAFPDEDYVLDVISYSSGDPIIQKKIRFSKTVKSFELDFKKIRNVTRTKEIVVDEIVEFFSGKYDGFDKKYHAKLKSLKKITGKDNLNNFRRGGRLEFLFFDLLRYLKNKKIIDEVLWYGNTKEFDLAAPAPGGKHGNPDIVFEIDEYFIVVELTTIKGVRAQWSSSEASSVPDHIAKMKTENPSKKVIGIFSAPSIHPQLEQNLMLNAKKDNVGMIFESCVEFAKFLSTATRKELKDAIIDKSKNQLSK